MTSPSLDLSIVTPVYGTPEPLRELVSGIIAAANELGVTFEIILVDDRCPFGSWATILDLAKEHPEIVAVRLSRNFGQHPAIFAGLRQARGARIAVMDNDLQDPPEELPRLYREALKGFEVVRARRVRREDSWFRRFISRAFYGTLTWMTSVEHSPEIANFGIYDRKVIDAILSWREDHRFFPAAVQWAGFRRSDLPTMHRARSHGRSNYSLRKLGDLAISIIISFSDKPLRVIALSGLVLSTAMLLMAFAFVLMWFAGYVSVAGYASLIVSIWFVSGLLLFAIGVCGLYIGQVMRDAKGRPNVIYDEIVPSRHPTERDVSRIERAAAKASSCEEPPAGLSAPGRKNVST